MVVTGGPSAGLSVEPSTRKPSPLDNSLWVSSSTARAFSSMEPRTVPVGDIPAFTECAFFGNPWSR